MLTRVHIQGFRSCVDINIGNLGPIVLLVGRNGAGKTNILKAINLFARIIGQQNAFNAVTLEPGTTSIDLEAKIENHAYWYRYLIELKKSSSGGLQVGSLEESLKVKEDGHEWSELFTRGAFGRVSVLNRSGPIAVNTITGCIPTILTVVPPDDQLHSRLAQFLSFMNKVRYYPLDEPSDPNNPVDAQSWVPDSQLKQILTTSKVGPQTPLLFGQPTCLRLVYMNQIDQSKLDELKSYLGKGGIKLIDDIIVDSSNESAGKEVVHWVYFKLGAHLGNGDRLFKFSELSLGTRRILQVFVSLIFDDSSVMLIEHPEDGIHSGLLASVFGLMDAAKDPTQIIMSSHSITLLNKMKPEDIRLVALAASNTTSVRALTSAEIECAKKYINEDGTLFEYIEVIEQD